jgi:hypothetical protein
MKGGGHMRKDVIFAVLLTFFLTSVLLIVVPTKSVPAVGGYDPWADINDDGKINMYDIGYIARLFGTTGTPINKTELLLQLLANVTDLQNRLSTVENTMNQTKTIRFFEPNETYIPSVPRNGPTATIAAVTWTPDNSTYNAILDTCVYFECKGDPGQDNVYLKVNGQLVEPYPSATFFGIEGPDQYSQTIVVPTGLLYSYGNYPLGGIVPNQISYTFSVEVDAGANGSQGRLWTKNINVVLTVIDGLPTS